MEFDGWQPQTTRGEEIVDARRTAGLAALFDDGLPAPALGEELPPLWHWVALPHWSRSGELGADGHPRRGGVLPPVPLPRRMIAGGEVQLHRALRLGEVVQRETVVSDVQHKQGRSGPLVLVSVTTRITDAGGVVALDERLDLIYRDTSQSPASVSLPTDAEPGLPLRRDGDGWILRTDASMLMRFSALTANAHRIHYDWPYATQVEGYPALVVHGPLQAIALAETHRLAGGEPIRRLRYRASTPLFCGQSAHLTADAGGDGIRLFLTAEGAERPGFTVQIES